MAEQKETVIIELKLEQDEARKEAERLTAVLDKQRKELADIKAEYRKNGSNAKEYGKKVFELNQTIKKNSDSLRQNTKEASAQNNSINALRASVSKLTAERNNINTATTEGAKRFKVLTKEIKAQTDTLKDLEGQAGDFRRNVGDYTNSILEASDQLNLFGFNLGGFKAGFQAFKAGIGGATFGLKGFRAALAATGIGAVIIAITSLIAFFKKTERGAQALRVIIAGFEAVLGEFSDILVKVGENIFKAFKDPVQAVKDFGNTLKDFALKQINLILDGVTGLGTAIKLAFSGKFAEAAEVAGKSAGKLFLGLNPVVSLLVDGADAAKDFADELLRDTKAAVSLEKRLNTLIVAERSLNLERAKANRFIKEQRFIAEDTNEAIEDRITALQNATNREQRLLDVEIANQKERVRIIQEQQKANETDEAGKEKLNNALIELENLQTASVERQTTVRNLLRTLEREQQKEAQDEFEQILDENEERLDEQIEKANKAVDANLKAIKKKGQEEIKIKKDVASVETEIEKLKAQQREDGIRGFIALSETLFGKSNELAILFGLADVGINLAKAFSANTLAAANIAAQLGVPGIAIGAAYKAQADIGALTTAGIATGQILANQVAGQFAGGGSFLTSGETYIKVGDNPGGVERVDVTPISGKGQTKINPNSGIQMAGGGSVIAAGSNIRSTSIQNESTQLLNFAQSALSLANRPIQVAVTDIRKTTNRVEVRENRAKI